MVSRIPEKTFSPRPDFFSAQQRMSILVGHLCPPGSSLDSLSSRDISILEPQPVFGPIISGVTATRMGEQSSRSKESSRSRDEGRSRSSDHGRRDRTNDHVGKDRSHHSKPHHKGTSRQQTRAPQPSPPRSAPAPAPKPASAPPPKSAPAPVKSAAPPAQPSGMPKAAQVMQAVANPTQYLAQKSIEVGRNLAAATQSKSAPAPVKTAAPSSQPSGMPKAAQVMQAVANPTQYLAQKSIEVGRNLAASSTKTPTSSNPIAVSIPAIQKAVQVVNAISNPAAVVLTQAVEAAGRNIANAHASQQALPGQKPSQALAEYHQGLVSGAKKVYQESSKDTASETTKSAPTLTNYAEVKRLEMNKNLLDAGRFVDGLIIHLKKMDPAELKTCVVPEIYKLVTQEQQLTEAERGQLVGYAFQKYGSAIFLPGTESKLDVNINACFALAKFNVSKVIQEAFTEQGQQQSIPPAQPSATPSSPEGSLPSSAIQRAVKIGNTIVPPGTQSLSNIEGTQNNPNPPNQNNVSSAVKVEKPASTLDQISEKGREMCHFVQSKILHELFDFTLGQAAREKDNLMKIAAKVIPGGEKQPQESTAATIHKKIDEAFGTNEAQHYDPNSRPGREFVTGTIPFLPGAPLARVGQASRVSAVAETSGALGKGKSISNAAPLSTKQVSKAESVSTQTIEKLFQQSRAAQVESTKIGELAGSINEWLGPESTIIKNKSGDIIIVSKDGTKKVRFDFNNPHGDRPHMHIEEKVNNDWVDVGNQHRIYPKETK